MPFFGRDAEFAENASRDAFAPAHESHQVHELIDAALAAAGQEPTTEATTPRKKGDRRPKADAAEGDAAEAPAES